MKKIRCKKDPFGRRVLFYILVAFVSLCSPLFSAADDKLIKASQIPDFEAIKEAIQDGADVNAQDKYKITPIMHAAFSLPSGNWNWTEEERRNFLKIRIEIIQYLVKKGANLRHRDHSGRTVLNFALFTNDSPYELIEFLLNAGAEADATDNRGYSAMDSCITSGFKKELELINRKGGKTKNKLPLLVARGELTELRQYPGFARMINSQFPWVRGSLLAIAVRFDQAATAKYLIHLGADMNIPGEIGPMSEAIIRSKPDLLKILLDSKADPNTPDYVKETPLHYAASYCGKICIKLLLNKGGNPNAVGHVERTPLFEAVDKKDYESAKLLIEYGADVNAKNDVYGPIIFRAIKNDSFDLVELLLKNGVSPHSEAKYEQSLFYSLAKKNRYDLIEPLRKRGMDLNKISSGGWTHLMSVAQDGNMEAIKYLLKHGSQPGLMNERRETALTLAIKAKQSQAAILLIGMAPPLKTYQDRGCVPLLLSVDNRLNEVAEQLLKTGVNPNSNCQLGMNALHMAALSGNLAGLQMLLKYGAQIDSRTTGYNNTSLHLAIYENQSKAAHYLVTSGTDLTAKNRDGKTPIMLADEKQMTDIILLLRNYNQGGTIPK